MASNHIDNPLWFNTKKIDSDLFLTTEDFYYLGNRPNIWLLRGTSRDVIIDCGLGVCNLKKHLQNLKLLDDSRECIVVCTHSHFDHSGGAHRFDNVFIHEGDYDGLYHGQVEATLANSKMVRQEHFLEQPYPTFSADDYTVPPTKCTPIADGHRFNLGATDEDLEIIHVPGHTPGNIVCYYPKKKALFSGDLVYDCEHGSSLFDQFSRASPDDYVKSAQRMIEWLKNKEGKIDKVCPGHVDILGSERTQQILQEYVDTKTSTIKNCISAIFK